MNAGSSLSHSEDLRALVAVDLGAESCRVSLLRWKNGTPRITLVHRFENHARWSDGGLRWELRRVEEGLDAGVRQAAAIAVEGIRSIAVDGWAVDYVRLNDGGQPLGDPYCYRDERTVEAEKSAHRLCPPERMRELTGIQLLRINTLYQLHADRISNNVASDRWLNLPEYILWRWGAEMVAEYTNATHTQLVELESREWSTEIFTAFGMRLSDAPRMVPPGTIVGLLKGSLASLPGLGETILIAPACHDTASAIAGIPAVGDDWVYISSGTWSLVGTLLDQPCNKPLARTENFTNFGAVGGRTCFHKNVNGMWLLRQCIEQWRSDGVDWTVQELIEQAQTATLPDGLIVVDEPELLLQGDMPSFINAQRRRHGFSLLDVSPENAPQLAYLIFRSLANRYAEVIQKLSEICEKQFDRLFVVGGGSRNKFLNELTAKATRLEVCCGPLESSTHGNFAVQLAVLAGARDDKRGADREVVSYWANVLDRNSE